LVSQGSGKQACFGGQSSARRAFLFVKLQVQVLSMFLPVTFQVESEKMSSCKAKQQASSSPSHRSHSCSPKMDQSVV
jgi:hypothetical protein